MYGVKQPNKIKKITFHFTIVWEDLDKTLDHPVIMWDTLEQLTGSTVIL